jgi:hypothetical protein
MELKIFKIGIFVIFVVTFLDYLASKLGPTITSLIGHVRGIG